jgi:hypothetical protein
MVVDGGRAAVWGGQSDLLVERHEAIRFYRRDAWDGRGRVDAAVGRRRGGVARRERRRSDRFAATCERKRIGGRTGGRQRRGRRCGSRQGVGQQRRERTGACGGVAGVGWMDGGMLGWGGRTARHWRKGGVGAAGGTLACEPPVEGRAAGGRQTRRSGWKGGRDFVFSSFFLVVEILDDRVSVDIVKKI